MVHQQGLLEGRPSSRSLENKATIGVTPSETVTGSMNLFSLPPLPTLPLDRDTPLLLPKLSARPKKDILATANSSPLLFNKLKRTNKKLVKSKSLQDIHRIAILKERAALISKRKLPRPTTDISVRAPKIVMKNNNTTSSSGGGDSAMIPEKNTSESSSYLGKMDIRFRTSCSSSHSTNVVPNSDLDSNSLLHRDLLPTLFASAEYDHNTTDHFHDIHTTHHELQENENSDYPEMLLDYEALTKEVDDDTWHDEVL